MATPTVQGAQTRIPQNGADGIKPVRNQPATRYSYPPFQGPDGAKGVPQLLPMEVYRDGMALADAEEDLDGELDPAEEDKLTAYRVPSFVKHCYDHIRGMRGDFTDPVSPAEMDSYTQHLAVRMFRAGYFAAKGGAR